MTSIIYKNELIKRRFFDYLKNYSGGLSSKTIQCYEKAIWRWEDFSHKSDFAQFNKTMAEGFKDWLKNKKKPKSQENISLSYCYDILRYLRVFFEWLSEQKGYKKIRLKESVGYLNLSKAERRMATQPRNKIFPSVEEVKKVIEDIKGKSEIEMRDRALISIFFLTGARISAVMTLPMKSFDRDKLVIDQNPQWGVKTKFSKKIFSTFITVSYKEPINYFLDWFNYLEKEKQFKPDDPIFPATKIENGEENISFYNTGRVESIFWKSSSSPRKVFEARFKEAGIKPYHPHSLRHLLVSEVRKIPLNEEQKKAISQNFGHDDVGTTFGSFGYGEIPDNRHIEIIRDIDFKGSGQESKLFLNEESVERLAEKISEKIKRKS